MDSTADTIAAALRDLIVNGELADGARLVERDLAERFSVSRIPLREALRKLEAWGLADIQRNRGAVVRTLGRGDIEEIYDLRVLIEGDAIYRAVKRMDEETLVRATVVHRLLGTAKTRDKQGELNREFHELIYAPCGNARQLRTIRELRAQVERYERLQTSLLAATPAFQREHADILNACREGNARAARAATVAHLNSARNAVIELLT
ncbi:GntR family transcriptional regulator [Trinickia caryophylli]|uniref:Transcriptional regulator, GntR family n=1 Tax=Trinickia caryophylli TaxID=28094 RepID=A0A1X7GAN5_TRICW|nr:GntR family transcriptional regulator [Trinickia caryophylli]PMS11375.1 GntR family transcriptional regulator [Trinickia caryophylli]TRX17569.1 GntR family transcriptional regulator [Trinickia caryophylli]WQE11680.1 GntR family transcriptional regulator [Trinickia caryophylli]SMF66391.1 transcriptional regulator, GntR family [Trinickia caryophylli]GLU34867.1 transcriptional regulator [Trinickia caryophylli]